MSKMCYIKPTRFKHSSGFRTFEVGYIIKIGPDNRVLEKDVLSHGADHVYQSYQGLINPAKAFGINMDLTVDGYIRIWGTGKKAVHWGGVFPMSSMELVEDERPRRSK